MEFTAKPNRNAIIFLLMHLVEVSELNADEMSDVSVAAVDAARNAVEACRHRPESEIPNHDSLMQTLKDLRALGDLNEDSLEKATVAILELTDEAILAYSDRAHKFTTICCAQS